MNKDTASDPGAPNDTVKRYTLYEVQTTGLEPAVIDDAKCENLTIEVCNHYMQILLDNGVSPDRIKVKRVS